MLRTSRTITFTTLIFVSACSFTISERATNLTVLPQNSKDDVTTTTTTTTAKTVTTSVYYEEEKMRNSLERTTERGPPDETSLENKRKKEERTDCHLTEETKDMLNCFFVTENVARTQPTANASQGAPDEAGQKVAKFNDTYPPKIFPQDKSVKSIDNADEATRRRLNHTFYTIVTPNKLADALSMGVDNKDNKKDTSATTLPTSKMSNQFQDTSIGNNSGSASQLGASVKEEGMSGGMVVLTVTLTFSVAMAIIYASTIAYKRYLEYRCNRRQLLDNDSEFDANDLHHFEL